MEPSEYENIAALEDRHWWHTGMAAISRRLLDSAESRGPARRILDAGCGTGGALGWLSEFGAACGIDYHPLALSLGQAKGHTALARAAVQRLPFSDAVFGIVTSFDVLYHLRVSDDEEALSEFARVLAPGGWLLLRVPALDWLRGAHDRIVHTRHRYTAREVADKLARAGLSAVRVTYANALLFAPAALARLWQRASGEGTASDVRLPPEALNRALRTVLELEARWLARRDLPIGLSVIALAQKP